jgi:hypothetical protein
VSRWMEPFRAWSRARVVPSWRPDSKSWLSRCWLERG